jgi:hypothetical protein
MVSEQNFGVAGVSLRLCHYANSNYLYKGCDATSYEGLRSA